MALDGRLPAARELIGFGASLVPPDLTYRTFVAPFVHPFVTSPPVVHAATAIARIPGVARGILHATGSHVDEVSRHWYERFMRSEPHVRAALVMMATFELPALLRDVPTLAVPLTLLALPDDADVAVIEVGTNEPGEIAILRAISEPNIAVVTAIQEEHLEGFGDLRSEEHTSELQSH